MGEVQDDKTRYEECTQSVKKDFSYSLDLVWKRIHHSSPNIALRGSDQVRNQDGPARRFAK